MATIKPLLLAAACLAVPALNSANAVTVVLDSGGCGTCNVLFTNGQVGDPVLGTTVAGQTIQYSSPSGTLATAASGQANIQSTTGGFFSDITWQSLSTPYTLEYFNLDVGDTVAGSPTSGFVDVTVFTTLNALGQTFTLAVDEAGANQIRILAAAGEGITGVLVDGLTNGLGIEQLIQDRIEGAFEVPPPEVGEVPLPGAAFLLGSIFAGAAGMNVLRRRRRP